MSVYVDNMQATFGRMKMCHMIADTLDELNEMADTIGVARKWIQNSRSGMIHYDVCLSKRALAVKAGAIEIDRRQLVEKMREAREADARNNQSVSSKEP
jgi:hypothetical protein